MKMRLEKRALDKIYKRRDRYEIPDWQREEVWDTKRKQALIDTILRGWKIPKFYFLKSSETPGEYEVVDGQQRLAAIFEFLDDELELSDDSAKEFGGKTYSELPPDTSDAFDDFEIDFDEIEGGTDEEVMEFFSRLQVGLQLNAAERLNAVPSKLTEFCRGTAKHAFFSEKTKVTRRRYAYFDVVAKSMAIEVEGFDAHLRLDELKKIFLAYGTFSDQSVVAKRMEAALGFLHAAIDDPAQLRSRALTQSLINLACRLVDEKATSGREKTFGKFVVNFMNTLSKQVELGHEATDAELVRFQQTVNANIKSGARIRHRILMRRLLEYEPSLLEVMDSSVVSQGGFKEEISSLGDEISTLVTQINEAHSGKSGENLFKPTNKTVGAMKDIGKQATSLAEYKSFIENAYFLFWEGPSKLKDKMPPSFVDVRDLRTDLEHDVDHGKQKDVQEKKLKIGAAFQKYSGVPSPVAASPQRFPLAQAKLLQAIKSDLTKLAAEYA